MLLLLYYFIALFLYQVPFGLWLDAFVVPRRVELRTSTLSVWRSNQLSYGTVLFIFPLPRVSFILVVCLMNF